MFRHYTLWPLRTVTPQWFSKVGRSCSQLGQLTSEIFVLCDGWKNTNFRLIRVRFRRRPRGWRCDVATLASGAKMAFVETLLFFLFFVLFCSPKAQFSYENRRKQTTNQTGDVSRRSRWGARCTAWFDWPRFFSAETLIDVTDIVGRKLSRTRRIADVVNRPGLFLGFFYRFRYKVWENPKLR